MIAAGIVIRRCRLSPASIIGSTPSLSTLGTSPRAVGQSPFLFRRHSNALGVETPRLLSDEHRQRHRSARWSSTSSSISASSDNGSKIQVTVTNSDDEQGSPPHHSEDENHADHQSGEHGLSKSPDQVAEEEIMSLQSEIRAHHRHAAFAAALETSEKMLERTSSHFGKLHPATASAYNNVGLMNKMLGNYGEAKDAYHESLRIYGEVVGKDHASYAAALSNLGMLERGRVLQSEAEEAEEGDDAADAKEGASEDGIELSELRDNNTPEKSKLSAMDRMQLNESAIEYFDEAYFIRLAELGPNHPHTITSRSQLGSAMAAAVLTERRGRIGGLVESELRRLKHKREVKDAKEMGAHVPEAIARAATKSSTGSRLTQRRWDAAQEHLRGALAAAVENPRGESVSPLAFITTVDAAAATSKGDQGQGLMLSPKKSQNLSKKEQKRLKKEQVREKRRATRNALRLVRRDGSGDDSSISGEKIAVLGVAGKVTTLSAASAAQNLAVFLKNYSEWMRLSVVDERDAQQQPQQQQQRIELNQTIQEARHLYEAALHVRSSMLPPHHPEVVAAKFSLAELLDSPRVELLPKSSAATVEKEAAAVDGNRANALREEILKAYNVEERDMGS